MKHKALKSFLGLRKSKEKRHEWQADMSVTRDVFWPEDYLAKDMERARIWTYGYNADVVGGMFQANNKNSISQHGRDFAVKLERDLDNDVGRKILHLNMSDKFNIGSTCLCRS